MEADPHIHYIGAMSGGYFADLMIRYVPDILDVVYYL